MTTRLGTNCNQMDHTARPQRRAPGPRPPTGVRGKRLKPAGSVVHTTRRREGSGFGEPRPILPVRRWMPWKSSCAPSGPRTEDLRRLSGRPARVRSRHQAAARNATRTVLSEPPRPHPEHGTRSRVWFAQRVRGGAQDTKHRVSKKRARSCASAASRATPTRTSQARSTPYRAGRGRVEWLEWNDVHRLIDAIPEYRLKMAAAWLFYTGCRVGEAINAQQRDVRRDPRHAASTSGRSRIPRPTFPETSGCPTRSPTTSSKAGR